MSDCDLDPQSGPVCNGKLKICGANNERAWDQLLL